MKTRIERIIDKPDAVLLTERQIAARFQLGITSVKKAVRLLREVQNSGVIYFGRSVRIDPKAFLRAVKKQAQRGA